MSNIPSYKVFKRGENELYVTDWADEYVRINHTTKNGCVYCDVTYREGERLVGAIREIVRVAERNYEYIKDTITHQIKVRYFDKGFGDENKDMVEIAFYAKHNIGFLWLTPKEALKLAKLIQRVIDEKGDFNV